MGRNSTNALCRRYVDAYMKGCVGDTVQRWSGVVRKDLFGLVDCIVLRPNHPLLFIQNCSEGSLSAHRHKARDTGLLGLISFSDVDFELWEWRKRTLPMGRKHHWYLRTQALGADERFFDPTEWLGPLFQDD